MALGGGPGHSPVALGGPCVVFMGRGGHEILFFLYF